MEKKGKEATASTPLELPFVLGTSVRVAWRLHTQLLVPLLPEPEAPDVNE